jgi:hypothetical protein
MHLISDRRELGRLLNSVDWGSVVPVDDSRNPLYDLYRHIEFFEDALSGALSRPEAPAVDDAVDAAIRSALAELRSTMLDLPAELRESDAVTRVRLHAEALQEFYDEGSQLQLD